MTEEGTAVPNRVFGKSVDSLKRKDETLPTVNRFPRLTPPNTDTLLPVHPSRIQIWIRKIG